MRVRVFTVPHVAGGHTKSQSSREKCLVTERLAMGIPGTGTFGQGPLFPLSASHPRGASRNDRGGASGHDVITVMVMSQICPDKFLLFHPCDNHGRAPTVPRGPYVLPLFYSSGQPQRRILGAHLQR